MSLSTIEQILDLARWAPSGDNTQPWRFEIVAPDRVIVHGFDTRDHCVYDLDGRPSQLALGALLETIHIAASGHVLRTEVTRIREMPDSAPTFDVRLVTDPAVPPSPLIPFIRVRTVQRRPMRTTPLTRDQKALLEASVAPAYQIAWFETPGQRWQVGKLMFRNAKLRLTIREAYEVHRSVIEWGARFSEDRIPEEAVGADPLTMKLMRWVMQSWRRVEFFNIWLAGTVLPRLQLDLVPSFACAAHLGLVAQRIPESVDDYVAAGRAMQRFWLEATRLGFLLQPEMTPLIFGRYHRSHRSFTSHKDGTLRAGEIYRQLEGLMGTDRASRTVFFARIGSSNTPNARSTRRPLSALLHTA